MRRPIQGTHATAATRQPRLDPQPGSWLSVESHGLVALDPARWAQRDQQFAVWQLVESWHRRRRLH